MPLVRLASALCLLFALSLAARAGTRFAPDDFDIKKDKVRAELVKDLSAVAKWCEKKKYLLERDRLYDEVLQLDPEDRKARKALSYKKSRDGEWEQDPEYRRPRNHGRVDSDALDKQEGACSTDYFESMLSLIEKERDELDDARYEKELRELLTYEPNDPRVRERLGYVEGWKDHPWVLPESKLARKRRDEIKALGERLREEAPAGAPAELEDFEGEMGLDLDARKNDRARAVGTRGEEELDQIVQVSWAAQDYFQEVFGVETVLPEGLTIYALEGPPEIEKFGPAYPRLQGGATAENLTESTAWWLNWNTIGAWDEGADRRLDAVGRQTLGWLMKHQYKITTRHGWIWEGFGLYLNFRLVKTRLGVYVRESRYDDGTTDGDLLARLKSSGANWFRLAAGVLGSEKKPNLVFFLGKPVTELTADELMYAYVLSAYLLELHGDRVAELFERIGNNEAPATVLEEITGRKLDALDAHIVQWVEDFD